MAKSIAQWLDKLGLGQYTQAFAHNGVVRPHLPHLTDDELKALGLPLDRVATCRLPSRLYPQLSHPSGQAPLRRKPPGRRHPRRPNDGS
jgi:hypothetical protein